MCSCVATSNRLYVSLWIRLVCCRGDWWSPPNWLHVYSSGNVQRCGREGPVPRGSIIGRVIEYFTMRFMREGVRGGRGEGDVCTLSPLRQRVSGELACRERQLSWTLALQLIVCSANVYMLCQAVVYLLKLFLLVHAVHHFLLLLLLPLSLLHLLPLPLHLPHLPLPLLPALLVPASAQSAGHLQSTLQCHL